MVASIGTKAFVAEGSAGLRTTSPASHPKKPPVIAGFDPVFSLKRLRAPYLTLTPPTHR